MFSTLEKLICPSNVSHKSHFMHQLQVLSEAGLLETLPCTAGVQQKLCTVLSHHDFGWLIPAHIHSLIWWKLICSVWIFCSAFRLRYFSLQCWLYFFSECVPAIKEKATQPGPRQQTKVDTNLIETGYWYSPCWLPAHLDRELFLLCILSMEVFLS